MKKTLLLFVFMVLMHSTGAVFSACDAALPAAGSRDDVLIVVNDNSLDSCEVGRYYAEKRGLGKDNIVHTATRPRHLINFPEFRILMDQIIRYMQDNTLAADAPPAPVCTNGSSPYYCQESVDHLRQYTKIRYLVTTRGVPMRTSIDGSQLSYASTTSVDNYLSYWLVRYFTQDTVLNFDEREVAFGDGRGMRVVDPQHDGELIVGRIDGVNLESARRVIDRTMEAERNGIYGKHYGSWFGGIKGRAQWRDYSNDNLVYGTNVLGVEADSWRYQLGMFGEARQQCIEYIDFASNEAEGKAPQECVVRFSEGPPGGSGSRTPVVDDALFYLGSLHGQSSGGDSFDAVLNYVRSEGCAPKLCKDAADPVACSVASTDVLKEINTGCVGVADGFIGYNYQSFPVASMALWPTGYQGKSNGGTGNDIAYPEVRSTIGFDDNHSLWFSHSDSIVSPRCYNSPDFSSSPTDACRGGYLFEMYPVTPITAQAVNSGNPQTYQVRFYYMANDIKDAASISVQLLVHEPDNDVWIDYGTRVAGVVNPGDTAWTEASAGIQLDPSLHGHSDLMYDQIEVRILSSLYEGEIGLDNFSVREATANVELITNPGFQQGHEQTSGGDHAAMFMSRLNGIGYWGSLSHHQSGGHSFSANPQETILYFLRGLPLGDAIWWGEIHNSGIFYGDPLYSPVAVHLDYINDTASTDEDTIAGVVELRGSAVNGRDPSRATTTYAVDYCPGDDFYLCDQFDSWIATGMSGEGGSEAMALGTWDTSAIATGNYVLRLAVTSNNAFKGRVQSLYDYYPVTIYSAAGDYDGDGLNNEDEIASGSDPVDVFSPVGEGMNLYADDAFHQVSSSYQSADTLYILVWNQAFSAGATSTDFRVRGGGTTLSGSLDDLGDGRYSAAVALGALEYLGDDIVVTTSLQLNNEKFDRQKTISVTGGGNFPPIVSVVLPTTSSFFAAGVPVGFSATASDVEDGNRTGSIEWTSSLDGELGFSGELSLPLSNGRHEIRASVTDSGGKTAYGESVIDVGFYPVVLDASIVKNKAGLAVKLVWSGIIDSKTYIHRDGQRISQLKTKANGKGGYIDDNVSTASGSSYVYKVCGGKTVCSPSISVTVE